MPDIREQVPDSYTTGYTHYAPSPPDEDAGELCAVAGWKQHRKWEPERQRGSISRSRITWQWCPKSPVAAAAALVNKFGLRWSVAAAAWRIGRTFISRSVVVGQDDPCVLVFSWTTVVLVLDAVARQMLTARSTASTPVSNSVPIVFMYNARQAEQYNATMFLYRIGHGCMSSSKNDPHKMVIN